MNGDAKIWRIVGLILLVPAIVGISLPGRLSLLFMAPAVMFYFWRWQVRRAKNQRTPVVVCTPLPAKPLELDVIDVDYEVIR